MKCLRKIWILTFAAITRQFYDDENSVGGAEEFFQSFRFVSIFSNFLCLKNIFDAFK